MRPASSLGRTPVATAFVVVTGAGLALLALIRKLTMRSTTHSSNHQSATPQRRTAYPRAKLLEKRQRLLEGMQAERFEPMEPIGVPGDPADMAHSISARETSYEIESVESRAVAQIDHVLCRIDSGKYGICEDCGRRIPESRLRIVPFTYLCVECKKHDEQESEKREMEAAFEVSDLEVLDETDTGDLESQHGTIRCSRLA